MLGMMEAILFACGDPIDIDKLAQALNTEEENVLELSRTLPFAAIRPHIAVCRESRVFGTGAHSVRPQKQRAALAGGHGGAGGHRI